MLVSQFFMETVDNIIGKREACHDWIKAAYSAYMASEFLIAWMCIQAVARIHTTYENNYRDWRLKYFPQGISIFLIEKPEATLSARRRLVTRISKLLIARTLHQSCL